MLTRQTVDSSSKYKYLEHMTEPKTTSEYRESGNIKLNSQDYQGAISDYTKAIEINPGFAEAYCNRGSAKSELKDYSGAISDYNKAIELLEKHSND